MRIRQSRLEFKEMLLSVYNSLSAGYSLENAVRAARDDMRAVNGDKKSVLEQELSLVCAGLEVNQPIEVLMDKMALRLGVDEASQFAQVLWIIKRNGGNLIQDYQKVRGAYEPENTGQRRNPYDGICQKNGTEDYVRDAVFYSFVCASYEPGIFSGFIRFSGRRDIVDGLSDCFSRCRNVGKKNCGNRGCNIDRKVGPSSPETAVRNRREYIRSYFCGSREEQEKEVWRSLS